MLVVAVKETTLLVAMQRIVGGVQVQPKFLRRLDVGFQEDVHQHPVQGVGVGRDPVVAVHGGVLRPAQLQAVQCARPRQRAPPVPLPGPPRAGGIGLAHQQRQQAVGAQRVVVVEVLVAQGDPVHPLRDQLRDRMLDLPGMAMIGEATRDPLHQPQPTVHLAQQDAAPVRGESAPIETTDDLTATEGVKFKLSRRTLCAHGVSLSSKFKSLIQLVLSDNSRSHSICWVESTAGAVVGRHDPIYTHSVSSRRSANRTCGFPASYVVDNIGCGMW